MTEGDSIHRLANGLRAALAGRKVTAFAAHDIDDDVAKTVIGRAIVAVEARGKDLLIQFDDGRALHVHLRMLGRLGLERPRSTFYRPRRTPPQLRLAVEGAAIVGNRIPVLRLLRLGAEARALAGSRYWVYGRRGQPCLRCATPITMTKQGAPPGRSTYHCPRCQASANEVMRDEPPR